jgi:hypothetical protein
MFLRDSFSAKAEGTVTDSTEARTPVIQPVEES